MLRIEGGKRVLVSRKLPDASIVPPPSLDLTAE
jgi:hypothetical protein